jgi:hypothetical protein
MSDDNKNQVDQKKKDTKISSTSKKGDLTSDELDKVVGGVSPSRDASTGMATGKRT